MSFNKCSTEGGCCFVSFPKYLQVWVKALCEVCQENFCRIWISILLSAESADETQKDFPNWTCLMWNLGWDCTGTSGLKVDCGVSGHCLALRILKQLSSGPLGVPSDRYKHIDVWTLKKKSLKAKLQMLHGLCICFICISSEESLTYHSIQLPHT